MFKVKTVFVLGAGASVELGLPTGEDLKPSIAKLLNIRFKHFANVPDTGDRAITEALRLCVHPSQGGDNNINPYLHEARVICDNLALATSIDNFIHTHNGNTKLELCGKLAIVRAILAAEARSKLKSSSIETSRFSPTNVSGTWYQLFFQKLTEGVARSDLSSIAANLSFIVFNYDRCFEHFLSQSLQDYFRITTDEALSILNNITIVHPYGTVGSLPWQMQDNPVGFGEEDHPHLLRLASNIKTFTQGMSSESYMSTIDTVISEAEALVFLGFSYQEQNLELIRPKSKPRRGIRVLGTSLGISNPDATLVRRDIDRLLTVDGDGYMSTTALEPKTCYDLFKDNWRWIGSPA